MPKVGYPLVFGAVALACAAAACWYAATPAASRTAGRAAGMLTAITGAFLIGTVWTTAVLVTNGVDSFLLLGTLGDGLETDASYLAGYWLLLTATLLGFAAAVLSLLPTRQPAWHPPAPVNPFAATPPYGIAIPAEAVQVSPVPNPAIDPLTGRPMTVDLTPRPLTVDPLTGQPLGPVSPPAGVPAPPSIGPSTGQQPAHGPVSPPAGVPVVDPRTNGAVSPYLPVAGPVDPVTGQPVAVPFTPEPVLPVNGTTPEPSAAEPPPIVLPDALPPAAPPGPAIPASEDPLAEPPKN